MQTIRTRATLLFRCRVPVVGAAMAGPAGGALAAAVSGAGGFGFIGNSKPTVTFLDEQLDIARGILHWTQSSSRLPVGVGFLAWILDEMPAASAEDVVARAAGQVECIWLSFGEDVKRWYDFVRAADRQVKVAIVVNSVREAKAAAEWGADVLIVQGIEAGGHGVANGAPIISLLPVVLDALQANQRPVVLAAGGISTGAQAAALLALGADGVVVGTRLVATPEALGYSQAQKAAIVAAGVGSSVRTEIFDIMRGSTGWPKGIDGRALRNKTYDEHIEGRSVEALKEDFNKAVADGDVSRIITWSGSSVGSVKAVAPAAEVVREFHRDILSSIQRLNGTLQE